MSDKSINVGRDLHGNATTGNNNSVVQNNLNSPLEENVTNIVADILEQLAQRYPKASEQQKETVFQMELQKKLEEDPTLRQRFLSAAKAGGFELAKVLTNNPFVSVPMEIVRGWIEV